MTAYDGEGMCPKIKAHCICCDGDGILLFNKPSYDSNIEYELMFCSQLFWLFVLHRCKKLSLLHLTFELLGLFVQLIGLS